MQKVYYYGIICCTLFVIAIFILCYKSPKENFEAQYKSDFLPKPCEQKPYFSTLKRSINYKLCTNEDGKKIISGEKSKAKYVIPNTDQFINELKIINNSPINIDVYYRNGKGCRKMFVTSLSPNTYVYSYKAEGQTKFRPGGQIFARYGDGTVYQGKLLFLPVTISKFNKGVIFGVADSTTLSSKVVYNLKGEIMFITFHNFSNADYDIYYYGDYIGTLSRIGSENSVIRSDNSQRGYRLNSYITLIMKGTNIIQKLKLNNLKMDTLNVGRVKLIT